MKISKQDIQIFTDACDNMVSSKFILVDKRIGDILKAIAQCKPVYNTIAKCVINFNFDAEWKIATAKLGDFRLPEDAKRIVALVFFMLNSIDSGKINISNLLMQHFSKDEDKRSSYTVFCEKIILPFKNCIVNALCPESKPAKLKETAADAERLAAVPADVINRLDFLAKDIKEYALGAKKIKGCKVSKPTYMQLLECLIFAVKLANLVQVRLLASSLVELSGKDKELISRLSGILEIV